MGSANRKRIVLSTHQVANMLGVSVQSVSRWIDSGGLAAERTPGGHRRVEPSALINFLRYNQMRVPAALVRTAPTILIVDDERDIAMWMAEGLRERFADYLVLTASSGFEAGMIVADVQPELVVLDLYMPGLDGFEVCHRIKKDPRTQFVQVIGVTAYPTPEAEQKIVAAGAEKLLTKPFEIEELASLVADLLNYRR